eukprot:11732244-Ditylum_brightwellii.AAC.2
MPTICHFEKQHVAAAREDEEIKLAGQEVGEVECTAETATEAMDEPKISNCMISLGENIEPKVKLGDKPKVEQEN